MPITWVVEDVVIQPTTFCNINCGYCYLRDKHKSLRMHPTILEPFAEWIKTHDRHVSIVWHAGEPLATGLKHYKALLEVLEPARAAGKISHAIQTNGTLITPEWCNLFKEFEVKVGLSIDGPRAANKTRVDLKGNPTFDRVVSAAKLLSENDIGFSAICVVTTESLNSPETLYNFFRELGCNEVGFNIEEKLGVHLTSASDQQQVVQRFWKDLFQLWEKDRTVTIREFAGTIEWMRKETKNEKVSELYDLFPTIGWNGDVTILAPEFLGEHSQRYGTFVVGNVLKEPFNNILERAVSAPYLVDYELGVEKCRRECEYFNSCRGGVASNKYFEHGWTGATETVYCRNREQRLVDGVLEAL